MSKVILKYQVSMLTCPSVYPAYPKILFPFQNNETCESSILYPVNYLIGNFKTIYPLVLAHVTEMGKYMYMRSLVIAFKNDEWCHFVYVLAF